MSGASNLGSAIPSSPIVVSAPNGEVRVEWRRFFLQLWLRTGGSTGGVAGTGTITGVTAGAGLNGGGTAGAVTVNLIVPVTIIHGGTGATTAAGALANLGALPTAGGTMTGPMNAATVGFNGTTAIAKPTVTGAKGGNTALGSLLTALAAYGLVIDTTTA